MKEITLKPGDDLTHVAVALQALRGARTAVVCAIDDAVNDYASKMLPEGTVLDVELKPEGKKKAKRVTVKLLDAIDLSVPALNFNEELHVRVVGKGPQDHYHLGLRALIGAKLVSLPVADSPDDDDDDDDDDDMDV